MAIKREIQGLRLIKKVSDTRVQEIRKYKGQIVEIIILPIGDDDVSQVSLPKPKQKPPIDKDLQYFANRLFAENWSVEEVRRTLKISQEEADLMNAVWLRIKSEI